MPRNGKKTANMGRQDADSYKAILRAAIQVFAKKGYHGCRISDVAREARVAYGLVYHYFEDKEQLLQSVFEHGWGGFVARVREVAESSLSLDQKVAGIASVAFEAYRFDPRAVKVIILEIARSPAVDRASRQSAFVDVIRMCERMFADAQSKGELAADADPLLCAALLFGSIEMALTAFVLGWKNGRSEKVLERAKDQLTESFLHGIQPGAEFAWKKDKSSIGARDSRRS